MTTSTSDFSGFSTKSVPTLSTTTQQRLDTPEPTTQQRLEPTTQKRIETTTRQRVTRPPTTQQRLEPVNPTTQQRLEPVNPTTQQRLEISEPTTQKKEETSSFRRFLPTIRPTEEASTTRESTEETIRDGSGPLRNLLKQIKDTAQQNRGEGRCKISNYRPFFNFDHLYVCVRFVNNFLEIIVGKLSYK